VTDVGTCWRQFRCVLNLVLQIFRLVFNTRFLWVINTELWYVLLRSATYASSACMHACACTMLHAWTCMLADCALKLAWMGSLRS
jgi:hypothetical protein